MAWKTLTADLVLAEFNNLETGAYNTARGDDSGANLDVIISGVVDEFVDAIASRGHPVGSQGTLPSGFIPKAVAMARWRYLLALPSGNSLLSAERKTANEAGEKLIQDIREGKVGVVGPDGTQSPAAAAGSKTKIPGRFCIPDQTH